MTIPYKIKAMEYCDYISKEAESIGCINTIKKKDGKIYGYNTDFYGFKSLLEKNSIDIKDKKCLVLGTGASSKTVHGVLKDMMAKDIIFVSRNGDVNYENMSDHIDANVIINTTPLGMYPNNGETKVELSSFESLDAVVDIVYNPQKTALILDAEELKIKAVSGLLMLIYQGKKAAEIFLEKEISELTAMKAFNEVKKQTQNIILIGIACAIHILCIYAQYLILTYMYRTHMYIFFYIHA